MTCRCICLVECTMFQTLYFVVWFLGSACASGGGSNCPDRDTLHRRRKNGLRRRSPPTGGCIGGFWGVSGGRGGLDHSVSNQRYQCPSETSRWPSSEWCLEASRLLSVSLNAAFLGPVQCLKSFFEMRVFLIAILHLRRRCAFACAALRNHMLPHTQKRQAVRLLMTALSIAWQHTNTLLQVQRVLRAQENAMQRLILAAPALSSWGLVSADLDSDTDRAAAAD